MGHVSRICIFIENFGKEVKYICTIILPILPRDGLARRPYSTLRLGSALFRLNFLAADNHRGKVRRRQI
jgi:hypothetical protein